jgi:cell division protein FtsL
MLPPNISLFPPDSSKHPKVQMVLAYAVLLTATLGGLSGIVTAYLGAKSKDVREAQTEILEKIEQQKLHSKELKLDIEQLKEKDRASEKALAKTNERVRHAADWICEANQGYPHASWPCYNLTWYAPPLGRRTPLRTTAAPWPKD